MAPLSEEEKQQKADEEVKKLFSSYLGLSFSLFLISLPKSAISALRNLQFQNKELFLRLLQAEEQLKQMKSRRKEDSKANARVVDIFASHRNAWQLEEKRLVHQIDTSAEEIAHLWAKLAELDKSEADLKARVEELKREVAERDEMISFMSRKPDYATFEDGEKESVDASRFEKIRVSEEEGFSGRDPNPEEIGVPYGKNDGLNPNLSASASNFWTDRATLWQDVQYESLESLYYMKHFVAREPPWKVDSESAGVSSKLKSLEQELLNLERIGKSDLSKIPSLMRKQAKRYQALAGKIDDLCGRMQATDPCEPTLSSELRTQRQTEFLLEAFRLQQRASETGQKLMTLQTETGKSYLADEFGGQAKLTMRRSSESIRSSFKEIQRNLEIWLARIIGDLEGILARDGASRVRDYYISSYPFVQ